MAPKLTPEEARRQGVRVTDPAVVSCAAPAGERAWIGVRFLCSGAYVRVHRDVRRAEYLARCPKCSKTLKFRVGEGGTDRRIFEVSC